MVTLHIPDIDDETYRRLADQAESNGRSLKEEVRAILGARFAPVMDRETAIRKMDAFRQSLEGKFKGDTTAWIREERDAL